MVYIGNAGTSTFLLRMSVFFLILCFCSDDTQTTFPSVWALMRLQTIPENIGGAGCNKIDWEIDDAVFKETA